MTSMMKAISSQTTNGVMDLRVDQFYFMGELLCTMTSDEISSLVIGGFEKYWYVIKVLNKTRIALIKNQR